MCGEVPLVTSSVDRLSYRNALHVHAYLRQMFAPRTASPLRDGTATNATSYTVPVWHRKPPFSPIVNQYLPQQFSNGRINGSDVQDWPPPSPDLNQFNYYVLTYMKPMVCASEVNTGQKLHRILSTARYLNNTTVVCKITRSLVRGVGKYIQADSGNFEQLAWIANCVHCALIRSR